jgi:uncharacterized membrane protein
LPSDITTLDLAAFGWFLVLWAGYNIVMDRVVRRIPAINGKMRIVRSMWMERFLDRDNRIMDAQLIGHTINSVTFLASTSMLVIAGLIGTFGAVDAVHGMVTGLGFTAATSKEFFELKLVLLVTIFAYAFFKFTWALRQYNYTCALMGAAPLLPLEPGPRRELADVLSDAMSSAISAFNAGLRSYYFALAALTWFIHPLVFAAATAWVIGLLLHRQFASPFMKVVGRYLRTTE